METVPLAVPGKLPINVPADSHICPLLVGGQFFFYSVNNHW
jgi:hypothetical protein